MKWKIFYDGTCHLCSREMSHYSRFKESEQLEFVDITDTDFSAPRFGLDPKKVNEEIHLLDPAGKLYLGMDAIIALWRLYPQYRWLACFASIPPVKFLMKIAYKAFAHLRPYLPKRAKLPGRVGSHTL